MNAGGARRLSWHGALLEAWARWLVVVGSYAGCATLFAAGAFGTGRSTPLHGAGHVGTAWQEALAQLGLSAGALALLVGCVLVLRGLGGLRTPRTSSAR